MESKELKIKFQELKANLLNIETQRILKERLDLDKLIYSIDYYIENIEQIEDTNLLATLENKLNRSIYATDRGVRSYLNEFVNNTNFIIESQSKISRNNIETIESKISREKIPTDLLEIIKNKLTKNENDLLVLKNNLENMQNENQEIVDKKTAFDEIFEKAKTAQEDYMNAKNAAIDDAKLKDSVKYWEDKQTKHETQFNKYKNIAIWLIFGLICILSLILVLHNYQSGNKTMESKEISQSSINTNNLVKEKQDDNNLKNFDYSKLAWYALMIFASSSAFWIIRITVKIALSNLHLSEDAHERVVMIQTYLAFIKEGELKDENEDKKLILSSLFRPTNIGIIQDESSVTITDIITAFKK